MTNSFTKQLSAALIGLTLLAACSRPVAYFQRGPIDPSTTQTVTSTASDPAVDAPADLLVQATEKDPPVETYVRNDTKLSTDKTLNKRISKVRHLFVSTPAVVPTKASPTSRRMNLAERLILKKMNRQIRHQLAPNHPEKALVKRGQLIGGLVLLIGGLALLIAGTGTVAFIGLILALIGAVGTVVSLIGIDS